ncbi:aromatic compound dioxygenase [Marasmius fiardii PR-910]|nr:aromatic compound dioxygenase [Marasmius fiardii PR-910]
MKVATSLAALVTLTTLTAAHPGGHHHISRQELVKRQAAAQKRHLNARNCAADIAAFHAKRKAKRALLAKRAEANSSASATSSAAGPHYTTLQNTTCILAPEVTEGPYYINNELVRQNLVEDQSGVQLVLDIGVMDTSTCTPLENAFVEIWSANATGVYGSYGDTSGAGTGGPGGNDSTVSMPASSMSMPLSMPSDGPGSGMGGGPGGGSSSLVRNETFLRGGYYTSSEGIVELTTIYPGFYTGRTAHVHTMIHLNWTMSANGTLVSQSGNLLHIGQLFFEEEWNDKVYATSPYTENTGNSRTYNDEDSILAEENADGNNAFPSLELLGSSLEDGILGYITIGVNSSASYSITNTNYLNSTGSD